MSRRRTFLQVLLARTRRGRREAGYVTIVATLMFTTFGFGLAALAVDGARWWVEIQRVQKAADVSALAGVTYLPMDLASAQSTARDIAARNGFPNSGSSSVVAETGVKPSQLEVTVCSTVDNSFGPLLGIDSTTLCRSATADYTGPAPMGSPCNTFVNEPDSGSTSSSPFPNGTSQGSSPYSNCPRKPDLWSTIEGPQVGKEQGDRFQTKRCGSTSVDGCTSARDNEEYNELGYFFLVRVQPAMVNKNIDLQLYDPEFANTGLTCQNMPAASNWGNEANPYVTDAKLRYGNVASAIGSAGSAPFCNGDMFPGGGSTVPVTSFALRQQTDTQDPGTAPVQNDTSGQPCIKQYRGQASAPTVNDLTSTKSVYDAQLASVFHNWNSLCTFTPARAGDYYLQVRTNIAFGGYQAVPAPTNGNGHMISRWNTNVLNKTGNLTTGYGNNSFSIRAVTPAGQEKAVSVSGYDRMPIFANADSATQTFNLIRVVPAGASKSIAFTFFDIGDASDGVSASVQVIPPADAKTTGNNKTLVSQSYAVQFPGGCRSFGGYAGAKATYANCTAPISNSTNDGKTQTLNIPIPNDYTCTYTALNGCWYQVKVDFDGGQVNDVTTWTATITGDPVRLIE